MTLRKAAVLVLSCLAGCLAGPGRAAADWPPEGRLLCSACRARGAAIATDGAGGAFVCWVEGRNGNDDLYLQRVLPSGDLAPGWPTDGVPVCTDPGPLALPQQPVVADASGGVFLAWSDYRNTGGTTGVDVYVQRVLADGSIAPGWTVNGVPATRAAGPQFADAVLPDGDGGVYVAWGGHIPDIYLQHLTADGQVAPGWPANGLPVCVLPSGQGGPRLAPDGTGGVFVVWADLRNGPADQYVQRVTSGGQIAPGWPEDGIRIAPGRFTREIMPDGASGAYLSLATAGPTADDDYFLLRFTADGALASGWPEGGVPVCLAPQERQTIRMEPDGAGGVLLAWSDERDVFDDDVFALRMRGDGSRYPGWPVDGLRVTNNTPFDTSPDLAADGMGGAYLAWEYESNVQGFDRRVAVQHLEGDATVYPGWPANGSYIPTVIQSGRPRMVADGGGGAIVAWEDIAEDVRALRFAPDGPTAVELSLVSAEVEPGQVRLTWYGAASASLTASVERRTETSDWERLAPVIPEGTGLIVYEDRAVTPATRYGYRLAYRDEDEVRYTDEAWVEFPALRFALRGLTPNPSAGDPVVAFSLVSGEPATLELYDLSGRRVLTREVGSLGAGTWSVQLAGRGRLAAGVYTVRLRQGANVATSRAVVMR